MAEDDGKGRGNAGAKRKRGPGKPFTPGHDIGKETRWVPGKSGNPIGMPKEFAHVRDLAKAYTGNAVRALVEVADDPGNPARVSAAKELLARGHGAVEQSITVGSDPNRPLRVDVRKLSDEDLEALERAALAVGVGASEPGDDSGGEGPEEAG